MILMSLSYVTLDSLWFSLCRTIHGNYELVHNCWGRCCSLCFLCMSVMHVVFCVAEWLLFQCLQWMILLFLDPLIKLFDFGISALQIARQDIKFMRIVRCVFSQKDEKWICACYKTKILPEIHAADLVLTPSWNAEGVSVTNLCEICMSHCVTPLSCTYVSAGEVLGRARSYTHS